MSLPTTLPEWASIIEAIFIIALVLGALFWRLPWRLSELNTKLKPIFRDWESLVSNTTEIKGFLKGKFPEARLFETKSPISLTEKGEAIARAVDSESLIKKYSKYIEIEENANAYNIQEACFDFAEKELLKKLDQEERNRIETEAFDNGLEIKDVLKVIAIAIRYKLLSEKNYTLEQVDKDDPSV